MVAKHTLVDYLRTRVSAMPGPISHLAVVPYTQLPPDWDQPDAPRRQLVNSTQLNSIAAAIPTQLRFDFDPAHDNLNTPHEFALKNLRRTHQAVENVSLRDLRSRRCAEPGTGEAHQHSASSEPG
ncbi:hypothetical protein [Brevibacterium sp. RIT 803]|uniref:hypothetical protein n=1 Tax=Brevibacterium sp. RIT 803 TaxID=2810210 RepID=UPI00207B0CBB|nr:hypothetical protein [Brevibacterium sp. RIT 803]